MNNIRPFIAKYFASVYMLIGAVFISIAISNIWLNFSDKAMQTMLLIVLSLIIGALGYERFKQKMYVEDKLVKLEEGLINQTRSLTNFETAIKRISTLELIEGVEAIHSISENEIHEAKHSIRATHFRKSKYKRKSNRGYYAALAKKIQLSDNFSYHCCFNTESFDSSRFKIFDEFISDVGKYSQMSHTEFSKQVYLNIMIFDQSSAYIGFPTNEDHDSMRYMIKFSAANPKELEVIHNLTKWYDKVLIPAGQKRKLQYVKNLNDI